MSTLHALTVPKWGMSMEEGEVAEWRAAVGDTLAVGDQYVDIETSKIINAAESPVAGTLVRILAEAGQTLGVGMLLGIVAQGDVSEAAVDAFIASWVPDAAAASPARSAAPAAGSPVAVAPEQPLEQNAATPSMPANDSDLSSGPDDAAVKASTVARRIAAANNINLHNVPATGRNGRVSKRDVERAAGIRVMAHRAPATAESAASAGAQRSMADDSQVASTPVARRLARTLNINLNDVTATGKRGRVSKEDVENAAIATSGAAHYREKKLSGMRKTIAARLSESKQRIPHYRVSVDIEIDSLLQQRTYMNSELGYALSVNDFVIKGCASALARVPEVNVQWADDCIRQFEQADISMAVAVPGGLLTPVLRDVGNKGLPQIASEARELALRANSGTLGIDECRGGTFSISNLGMYDVDQFDAIINLPQAAILAVASGKKKPVVRGDSLVSATLMRVSLSSDHRAIDGASAARFLQALKGFLEHPASMLV